MYMLCLIASQRMMRAGNFGLQGGCDKKLFSVEIKMIKRNKKLFNMRKAYHSFLIIHFN